MLRRTGFLFSGHALHSKHFMHLATPAGMPQVSAGCFSSPFLNVAARRHGMRGTKPDNLCDAGF